MRGDAGWEARRDSPHFRFNRLLTSGIPEPVISREVADIARPRCISRQLHAAYGDMRHTFQMLLGVRRASSHNVAQIVFQGPHVVQRRVPISRHTFLGNINEPVQCYFRRGYMCALIVRVLHEGAIRVSISGAREMQFHLEGTILFSVTWMCR